MSFTYICIHCKKYVKDVEKPEAQKFLNRHNKEEWTGVRKSRICVTDLISNELLEQKIQRNYTAEEGI